MTNKEKELIIKIIYNYPEIVWYCLCYDSPYEMLIDRPMFMNQCHTEFINDSFYLIKKWLNRPIKSVRKFKKERR